MSILSRQIKYLWKALITSNGLCKCRQCQDSRIRKLGLDDTDNGSTIKLEKIQGSCIPISILSSLLDNFIKYLMWQVGYNVNFHFLYVPKAQESTVIQCYIVSNDVCHPLFFPHDIIFLSLTVGYQFEFKRNPLVVSRF